MDNIKNFLKILLALGVIGLIITLVFFGFLMLLGVATGVAVIFYVRQLFYKKNNKNVSYYYETTSEKTNSTIIEGEIIEQKDDIK
jgi:hypothetical protein